MRALGVVLAVLLAAVSADARTRPALKLIDPVPFVVRGTGFKPAERVHVTLVATPGRRSFTRRASRSGSFTVRIPVTPLLCQRARAVVAVGARGSRAWLALDGSDCWPPPPVG
jgi:hypothetical protein